MQQTEHRSFNKADEASLSGGHDAWVVGDETVVVVDWFGASNYAK